MGMPDHSNNNQILHSKTVKEMLNKPPVVPRASPVLYLARMNFVTFSDLIGKSKILLIFNQTSYI